MKYQLQFLSALIVACSASLCQAQIITFSNGAPFKTSYCHEDKNYAITGSQPTGGSFSGCGVFQQGSQWYFNPVAASGNASVFPYACTISYMVNNVTVNRNVLVQKPVVIHPPLQDTFSCDGTVTLNAETLYAGDYDYAWTPAGNLATPGQHNTVGTLTVDQTFIVKATDLLSGCAGSDTVTILNRTVHAAIRNDDDRICPYDSFRMAVENPVAGTQYNWYYPGYPQSLSTDTLFRNTLVLPGDYAVVMVASNDKCSDTAITDIHIIDVGLQLSSSRELIYQGEVITLQTTANTPYLVTGWLPEYLFADQTNTRQTLTPDSSRWYYVFALSDEGCRDSASVEVKVNPRIFLPNAFSPNGDGLNDYFKPYSGGDDLIIGLFQVFNRNGQLVYSVNGGAGSNMGWNGSYNGKAADTGVYYYYAELATKAGGYFKYKGDVALIR